VKSGLNTGGPPSKAKYSLTTDSEPVRRLNDEKNPDKGSSKNLKSHAYEGNLYYKGKMIVEGYTGKA